VGTGARGRVSTVGCADGVGVAHQREGDIMAGRKLFMNGTDKQIKVTLFIRAGDNPANSAGNQTFDLSPHQQSWVSYGNNNNIYLNGFSVVSLFNGELEAEQQFVIHRGGPLDNQLNMNNVVQLLFDSGVFHIKTWNG
jgi:hypothetical protein